MELIAYGSYLFLIILGFLFRRSRLVSVFLIGYIWILFALNTGSPDYRSYESAYYGGVYALNMEAGFTAFCAVLRALGFTYQQFRMIWGMIYVLLLVNFTFRCTRNPNFVFALMLICPVLIHVSGLRFAVAYMLVLNFALLLKRPSTEHKILFLFGTLLASMIHVTSIFYLIFLLPQKKMTKNQMTSMLITVCSATAFIYSPLFTGLMEVAYDLTGIYTIQKWLIGNSTNTRPNLVGFSSIAIFLFAYIFLAVRDERYIRKWNEMNHLVIETTSNGANTILFLKNICLSMMFLLPVIMISMESRRFLYGILLAYYCLAANCLTERKFVGNMLLRIKQSSIKIVLAELIVTLGTLWMYMYSYQSHDVMATLYQNLVWAGIIR